MRVRMMMKKMMMMMMVMMMMMMMMMRGRWRSGCWAGGRSWCGGEDVEEGDRSQDREAHFVRACAVEMHMLIWQGPFCMANLRKNAGPQSRARHGILCEPAQSKCTWTFHKGHFVWKFTRKMPDPNKGKMPDAYREHLDSTPGLYTYRKNPSVWPHCFGETKLPCKTTLPPASF